MAEEHSVTSTEEASEGTSTDKESSENAENFALSLILERQKREFARYDSLDNKAAKIITFAGIIIGLFASVIGLPIREAASISALKTLYTQNCWILLVGLAFLTLSILTSVGAYFTRTLIDVPNTEHLINKYVLEGVAYRDMVGAIGKEVSKSIESNNGVLNQKVNLIKVSMVCFAVGMIAVVIFTGSLCQIV